MTSIWTSRTTCRSPRPRRTASWKTFRTRVDAVGSGGLDISVLLSRALLAYTVDFERESAISLPISADTMRVLTEAPTALRDLPRLSGVSREAQNMATGFLSRIGCAVIEPAPGGRGQAARLTEKGLRAKAKYQRVLAATDLAMADRFGADSSRGYERTSNRRPWAHSSRIAALSGRMAGKGRARRDPAAPSDGPAPRRLSRRELSDGWMLP